MSNTLGNRSKGRHYYQGRTIELDEAYEVFTRPEGECRIWTRSTHHAAGYGHIGHEGKIWQAHRLFYEHFVGPIPAGYHLHHICERPGCVNPRHLQPLTPWKHVDQNPNHCKRVTQCPKGHPYTPENTVMKFAKRSNGHRYWVRFCRTCRNLERKMRRRLNTVKRREARHGQL